MSRKCDRMKEVSIIIPTKNNGDIIEKCLHSIKNLDYPKDKYEVIIVDGHSRKRHTIR